MEPVTHILTGACLSRTGLNRRAAYTTLAMVIGAELPDIDTLWGLRGPVVGLEHHRGITHTFLGVPFEAAIIVLAIYIFHRWRLDRAQNKVQPAASNAQQTVPATRSLNPGRWALDPLTAAPINWPLLYLFTLIALLSHLFLDYTNNYGIRPFFPFNPHWYAASIVFIFDPLLFAILLLALLLPYLFGLVGSEVGARRQPFAARGWSIAALFLLVFLWTFREVEHNHAIQLAMAQTLAEPQAPPADAAPPSLDALAPPNPTPIYLQAQRALANPDPLDPFRWYTVTDFGPFYQRGIADTRNDTLTPNQVLQPKLNPSPALTAAEASLLGRVYLDWSPMPFLTVTPVTQLGLSGKSDQSAIRTIVQFADPRFMGDTLLLHPTGAPPLTGKVGLNAANHVIAESFDGRAQHF
jgi:inner membrane protein